MGGHLVRVIMTHCTRKSICDLSLTAFTRIYILLHPIKLYIIFCFFVVRHKRKQMSKSCNSWQLCDKYLKRTCKKKEPGQNIYFKDLTATLPPNTSDFL